MLWSGGIDSTTALVALLHLGPQVFRTNNLRLVIRYGPNSRAEAPSFFAAYVTRQPRDGWEGVLSAEALSTENGKAIADHLQLDTALTITGVRPKEKIEQERKRKEEEEERRTEEKRQREREREREKNNNVQQEKRIRAIQFACCCRYMLLF